MFFNKWKIPMAQSLCVDDLGWVESKSLKEVGGPPRLHSDHNPTIEDYENLINMAKNIGTRPLCGFVMGEFDKSNICAKDCYNKPQAPINMTEFGKDWDNKAPKNADDIMNCVKNGSANMEFVLHGVRHGHFEPGKWMSSEWAKFPLKDKNKKLLPGESEYPTPWDEENKTDIVIAQCYKELIRQYFTEEELDFPETFIPPNHLHYFNPGSPYSTFAILEKFGVKYAVLRCSSGTRMYPGYKRGGTFDHSIVLEDRRAPHGCSWSKTGVEPKWRPREFPFIETHFNNLWGSEDYWGNYLYEINRKKDHMLGKNAENSISNFAYMNYVKLTEKKNTLIIDTNAVPEEYYKNNILSNLVLKIYLGKKEIEEAALDKGSVVGYYKDKYGYGYLTLCDINNPKGRLEKGIYTLTYKIGKKTLKNTLDNHKETYCIYGTQIQKDTLIYKIKSYSSHTIKIKTDLVPEKIEFSNKNVSLVGDFELKNGFLTFCIKGKSMIGEETDILIHLPSNS